MPVRRLSGTDQPPVQDSVRCRGQRADRGRIDLQCKGVQRDGGATEDGEMGGTSRQLGKAGKRGVKGQRVRG